MEKFLVSARKYRPADFSDVVGQESVTQTLEKAIKSQHLGHSFLFCGPRGVGKTTCARILAKKINRQSEEDERDYSINIFELDAASNNSVEDIKSLMEQVRIPPQIGDYKVYIIDEVHMLSQQAFNAFLKTLEEPPSYAIFILATTEKHKILPTILSRCQIYDFKRISVKDIVAHLVSICEQEKIDYEEKALNVIAQKADGALRDALSLFDRLVDRADHKIDFDSVISNLNILDYDYYFTVSDYLMGQDIPGALNLLDEVLEKGFETEEFMSGLTEHLRNLMVSKEARTRDLLDAGADLNQKYQQQAVLMPTGFLLNALNLANECQINLKTAKNKRLQVELTLMKIAHLPNILNWDAKKKPLSTPEQKPQEQKKESPAPENSTSEEETHTENIPEENSKPTTETKVEVTETTSPKTTPKKREVNKSGRGINLGVNLSKLKNREIEEEKEAKEEQAEEVIEFNESVTNEMVSTAWEKMKSHFKEQEPSYYPAIDHSKAAVKDEKVELTFDSKGSKDMFLSRSEEVLRIFFNNLGSKVPTEFLIEKKLEDQAPKKVFTSKDKWELLKEKNPNLELLKEKFQLYIKE